MDFVSAFLGVLAIIGIIVVGGFTIFFLGDLVLSILDPNYVRFGKGKKREEKSNINFNSVNEIKQLEAPKEETKEISYKSFVMKEEKEAEKSTIKENKKPLIEQGIGDDFFDTPQEMKKEEELEIKKSESIDALRAEEEQFRINMLKAIEERRARRNDQNNNKSDDINFDKFFFDDDDINVFEDEDKEDSNFEQKIDDIIPADSEIADENFETIDKENEFETENISLSDDIQDIKEKYELEISKLELENLTIRKVNEDLEKEKNVAKEEMAKLLEEKINLTQNLEETSNKKVKSKGNLSIEEYEDQFQKLTERLSENEKDFRRVKKDFLPLKKVRKTLESDEKKLRRREAIVAKQKVELYGVNNIGDIDQEKAKKLTQDLDLLEGLKLSVKHCQEVMEINKDRYPILEKIYDILLNNNKTLKSDIQELEEKIVKLKETENN